MKTRLITIHKNINQALTTKRGNKMGYAVSYKRSGRPISRRAKRQSPANKAQRDEGHEERYQVERRPVGA